MAVAANWPGDEHGTDRSRKLENLRGSPMRSAIGGGRVMRQKVLFASALALGVEVVWYVPGW
jgi:hypothetical protein